MLRTITVDQEWLEDITGKLDAIEVLLAQANIAKQIGDVKIDVRDARYRVVQLNRAVRWVINPDPRAHCG